MKKIKIVINILLMIILLCGSFVLASCGNDGDDTHTCSMWWYSDDLYHWGSCKECDKTSDKAEHSWTDRGCSICGRKGNTLNEYFSFTLLSDKTYEINTKDKNNLPTVIVIPEEYLGKPVTSIGNSAFYNCTDLTSVEIPDSVTSIGPMAFYGCSGLTTIEIPSNATYIGSVAFYGCVGLTAVEIPDSVTYIGGSAFGGCNNLTEITLPYVGGNEHTSGLKKNLFAYIFGADDGNYSGLNECVPASLKSVTITSATSIGDCAFYGCSGLTSIEIAEGVTNIGDRAFYYCLSLIDVVFEGVPPTVVGNSAFSYINSKKENCYCKLWKRY